MTTGQFAKAVGVPWSTVVHWAQTGVIPGVTREETLRGPVWAIPESALDTFDKWRPKIGRPPKSGSGTGAGSRKRAKKR